MPTPNPIRLHSDVYPILSESHFASRCMGCRKMIIDMLGIGTLDITEGLLAEAAKTAFTCGGCSILAIALHDATGWPIIDPTLLAVGGSRRRDDAGNFRCNPLHLADHLELKNCGKQKIRCFCSRKYERTRTRYVELANAQSRKLGCSAFQLTTWIRPYVMASFASCPTAHASTSS